MSEPGQKTLRNPFPVYPFLLGLYPVLAMYAHNADQLTPDSLLIPCLAALGISALALLVMRWLCGSYRRGAIPAALAVVFFFAHGHVQMPFRRYGPIPIMLSSFLLALLMLGIVVTAVLLVRRKRRAQFSRATVAFNLVALVLALMPSVRVVVFEAGAPRRDMGSEFLLPVSVPDGENLLQPNILYLVPDRYPSESTLAEVYDYDNSGFLAELRARGFYVADESRCNYGRTDLSLAATLNMEYLDSLLAATEARNLRRVLYWAIQDNEVVRFLKARGYRYLHFGTWWSGTSRSRQADANFNRMQLPEFMMMLYRMSLAAPIGTLLGFGDHQEQWARVHYKFDLLETLDTVPGPVFAFAHFLLPHEPYVLDTDGSFVSRLEQLRRGTIVGFTEQVTYINRRLLSLADRLIKEGNPRPWAIIIQSDEGPHPPDNFEHTDSLQTLRAKFRILSAFYLPSADIGQLNSEITPVNTFRLLLDGYFGTGFGPLPDRSYLFQGEELQDITNRVWYR